MRVILIDDEPLILAYFEKLLKKIGGIDIIGTYINPYEALKMIQQDAPDIIFLDIEMPETNGLELAETIQSKWPHIKIVFVTAHSEYAVKAFDLNAVDYLLKPVQLDRLSKTIDRLKKDFRKSTFEITNYDKVCCFRSLHFKRTEVINVRWRTLKAKELFAFLLQYHGKPVSKSMLLDMFWSNTDLEKGMAHLYTTIYQIRKMLRDINFHIEITSLDNNYVLNLKGITLDIKEWEQNMELLPPISKDTLLQHTQTLELYQGNYLEEEGYLWAESERERLRNLWLSHAKKVTEFLISNEQITVAISICQRMQELFPHVEAHYFVLMQLYDKLGDRTSVESQYKNLKKMCVQEYGVNPDPNIQAWYEERKNIYSN